VVACQVYQLKMHDKIEEEGQGSGKKILGGEELVTEN